MSGLVALGLPALRLAGLLILALVVEGHLSNVRAEYKIAPGDIVGLTVIGVPDLSVTASVDPDGKAALPLIGPVPVGGLSVEEATARLRSLLPEKEYNRHLADGRDVPVIITPSQISLDVAEFRPVYLNGDVGRPGALTYQADLTIRKAIASAGGVGRAGVEPDDPLTLGEVTSDYRSLLAGSAKWQEVVIRLQAELDRQHHVVVKPLADMDILATLDKETIRLSEDRLNARTADLQKERLFLDAASDREGQRAKNLAEQRSHDIEGLKIDTDDLQRYQKLFSNGEVAAPTLSLAHRTVLASSTRALQTTGALTSVLGKQSDDRRRLERMDDIRRIDLLTELQDATLTLAGLQAKLQAVRAKMRYLGVDPASRSIDDTARIIVTRSVAGEVSHVEARPDDLLQPGDIVDVLQGEAKSQN